MSSEFCKTPHSTWNPYHLYWKYTRSCVFSHCAAPACSFWCRPVVEQLIIRTAIVKKQKKNKNYDSKKCVWKEARCSAGLPLVYIIVVSQQIQYHKDNQGHKKIAKILKSRPVGAGLFSSVSWHRKWASSSSPPLTCLSDIYLGLLGCLILALQLCLASILLHWAASSRLKEEIQFDNEYTWKIYSSFSGNEDN